MKKPTQFQCKDMTINITFIRRKYGVARWDIDIYVNGRISAGGADLETRSYKMENAVNELLNHIYYDRPKVIKKHMDVAKKKRDGSYVFNLTQVEIEDDAIQV